jgi:hypothetical protein
VEKYGIKEGLQPYQLRSILLDNIEQIHADGVMKLDEFYVASIVKYRSIIALMQDFFSDMWEITRRTRNLITQNYGCCSKRRGLSLMLAPTHTKYIRAHHDIPDATLDEILQRQLFAVTRRSLAGLRYA